MCGIVGLFLKEQDLRPRLGSMLGQMLQVMTDRGPDSAGFAVYGDGAADHFKITVRGPNLASLSKDISNALGTAVGLTLRDTHAVLSVPDGLTEKVRQWLSAHRPDLAVIGAGHRIELYKEVGLPADVIKRFNLPGMAGTHGVGHTRMATESAVTTAGAHPFSTGADQCLVHNGSLSNHRSVRRNLEREGLTFETDNDTEVAAGYQQRAQHIGHQKKLHGHQAESLQQQYRHCKEGIKRHGAGTEAIGESHDAQARHRAQKSAVVRRCRVRRVGRSGRCRRPFVLWTCRPG